MDGHPLLMLLGFAAPGAQNRRTIGSCHPSSQRSPRIARLPYQEVISPRIRGTCFPSVSSGQRSRGDGRWGIGGAKDVDEEVEHRNAATAAGSAQAREDDMGLSALDGAVAATDLAGDDRRPKGLLSGIVGRLDAVMVEEG